MSRHDSGPEKPHDGIDTLPLFGVDVQGETHCLDPIRREIDDRLDLDNVGSFPSTPAVIREVVMEDQIPVASSSNGYYVIEDEAELRDYVDQLESRVMNITERKFAVQRAVLNWDEDIVEDDSDLL